MNKEIYKYLKIPYEVSECKNICSTAKLLYGRYCYLNINMDIFMLQIII